MWLRGDVSRARGTQTACGRWGVYRTGVVAWHEVNIPRRLERHPCPPSLLDAEEDCIVMTFAGSQCLVEILSSHMLISQCVCYR